jgi:streptogramin lyase
MHRLKYGIIGLTACLAFASVCAEDFSPSLEQFNHRSFTRSEGAPSYISAFAQTADGMLWLGTSIGLARFDGAKFVSYPGQSDEPLPSANISALISSPDGGLWIGFRFGGICFLRNGCVTRYGASEGIPNATVWQFAHDRDGTLLIATTAGLLQLHGRVAQRIAPDMIARAVDVLVDHSGTLWVATGDNVVARTRNDAQFHEVGKTTQAFDPYTQVLAEAPDGHVWVSDAERLTRLDPAAPESGAVSMRAAAYGGRLLIDTSGNAWFSSTVDGSLNRWPVEKMAADMDSPERVVHAETLKEHGLGIGLAISRSIIESHKGQLWAMANDGPGATFCFSIPCASNSSTDTAAVVQ